MIGAFSYLDYKVCLSILKTIDISKQLHGLDFCTNLSIRTFEDHPFMNGFDTLGSHIADVGAIRIINGEYNISTEKQEYVVFTMDHRGKCNVIHIKEGDEESLEEFAEFPQALDHFYDKCYISSHPEDETYVPRYKLQKVN